MPPGLESTKLNTAFSNFEINISNPRARIFKLNGLRASDYDPKKQQQLLEGLLKESEDFWGHSRSEQVNKNLPELSRFFYRTLVESKDETEQRACHPTTRPEGAAGSATAHQTESRSLISMPLGGKTISIDGIFS